MASIRQKRKGGTWYYRLVMADGSRKEFPGCRDKKQTAMMAAQAEAEQRSIRQGLIDPREVQYRKHAERPLREHLADFLRSIDSRGVTGHYLDKAEARIVRLFEVAGMRRVGDLSLSGIEGALVHLRKEGKAIGTLRSVSYRA